MTFQEFINKYNGTRVGSGQCPALVKQYEVDVLGIPPVTGGDAKNWYLNFENTNLPKYYTKVAFNGSNRPKTGDVIVWSGAVGQGHGHIAIYIGDRPNGFQSFDQNWNTPLKCSIQNHSWNHILGWLVPIGSGPEPPPPIPPPEPPTPPPTPHKNKNGTNFKWQVYTNIIRRKRR